MAKKPAPPAPVEQTESETFEVAEAQPEIEIDLPDAGDTQPELPDTHGADASDNDTPPAVDDLADVFAEPTLEEQIADLDRYIRDGEQNLAEAREHRDKLQAQLAAQTQPVSPREHAEHARRITAILMQDRAPVVTVQRRRPQPAPGQKP
jgi:hypothetical protein